MKKQYFGDINDYRKYGLLRLLSGEGAIRTTVCWMLTDHDNRNDGRHISYLSKPERYRRYDPALFDFLQHCLTGKGGRNVSKIENSGMLPSTSFYSKIVTDNESERKKYFSGLFSSTTNADLIFFDPDNGIEVKSIIYGARESRKYMYWHELRTFYGKGHSLLVYQHFPRVRRDRYTKGLVKNTMKQLGANNIITLASSTVVYILISQNCHHAFFKRQIEHVKKRWKEEFLISNSPFTVS